MSKTIIIVIIVFVVLLIGAGAAWFFLVWNNQEAAAEEPPVEKGVLFHTGEVFVTNLMNSELLLKSDVYINVPDRNLQVLQDNVQQVRDRIIRVLRQFTEEDIAKDDFQDLVRDRIKNDLQNTLNIDKIIDIYFAEFVLQ